MELHLPDEHVPEHPDNKQLAKSCSSDDYSPLDNCRRCTDVLFLLLIICSWVAMTGLGLASMGFIESEYIKQGGMRFCEKIELHSEDNSHVSICNDTRSQ